MKEMTIEQKAQRYDETLDNAKVVYKTIRKDLKSVIEQIFPELKESEDEKMRKHIIEVLKDNFSGEDTDKCIAWLEKQGEQKPFDYENANIQQKDFAPKQEPKFKVGDWVILDRPVLITKVEDMPYNTHRYWTFDGTWFGDATKAKLWTIQDAKDGDVLAFDNDNIAIFKNLYSNTTFHSYCHIVDGIFKVSKDNMPDWWEAEGFRPATKEQRDTLMKAMTNAEYTFDFEKKELKKIK